MATSIQDSPESVSGTFSDGLTLSRLFLAIVVGAVILLGWPGTSWALLATVLFALGAITDLVDDMIGGPSRAGRRMFGWFDDIADAVLIGAALLALLYVTREAGVLGWAFAVPALIYVGRDVLLGLFRGFTMSKSGLPSHRLADIKTAIAMLAVALLIAAPWLQFAVDRSLAGTDPDALKAVFDNPRPYVWQAGQILLWIAAILSIVTAFVGGKQAPLEDAV